MQESGCGCAKCRQAASGELEVLEFEAPGPFGEQEEIALAMELMSVASEEELEQFLGKMFKGIWKGVKKVGSVIGKVAKPLGGVLKGLAKTALPFVGKALGSFIPIPGVGTMLGGALGSAVAKALEMEAAGLDGEERELDMARRFVRIAGTAAQQAGMAGQGMDPRRAARDAVDAALRCHLPRMRQPGSASAGAIDRANGGTWRRQGRGQIVLDL
ncbi:hypothetical protein INH39_00965 [Massilia violaceinigra]|uniref:Uncharacterized protein n=1 Tax=Massilia violaceinigra TaxID=2045208 RepID=A0ABY4A886_9BURK|nr:hypothetical protein [Massilia violaceinigra]UOD30360.1 hypothetical protein INH39_00965 [Massilia violaceinigra]